MSLLPPRIIDVTSDNGLKSSSFSSSNFTITLPAIDARYDRVAVVSASIPKTYYNVEAPYNTFVLTESKTPATITIPRGNYSFSTFAATLKTLLNSSSPTAITYNTAAALQTGTLSITSNSATVSSIFLPLSSNLYKQFGAEYDATIYVSQAAPYVSPNVCTFTINAVVINSSLVQSVSTSLMSGSILQIININNSQSFAAISYDNFSPFYNSRPAHISTTATFTITDLDDTILNLNGIPCCFSIMFFKFDNTNLIVRKNIYITHAATMLNDHIAQQQAAQPAQPTQQDNPDDELDELNDQGD
jgi:hypothetical protein